MGGTGELVVGNMRFECPHDFALKRKVVSRSRSQSLSALPLLQLLGAHNYGYERKISTAADSTERFARKFAPSQTPCGANEGRLNFPFIIARLVRAEECSLGPSAHPGVCGCKTEELSKSRQEQRCSVEVSAKAIRSIESNHRTCDTER